MLLIMKAGEQQPPSPVAPWPLPWKVENIVGYGRSFYRLIDANETTILSDENGDVLTHIKECVNGLIKLQVESAEGYKVLQKERTALLEAAKDALLMLDPLMDGVRFMDNDKYAPIWDVTGLEKRIDDCQQHLTKAIALVEGKI